MQVRFFCILISLLGGLASACGENGKGAPTATAQPSSESVSAMTSAPTQSPTPAYSTTDLSVSEDFEVEARQAITPDSYKGDLERLTRELEPDSPAH